MAQTTIQSLNVNQLKIFQAVYATKSMTVAAQDLFLTQSGVSQHIKKLETDLGTPLFVRNRGELFATPEADQLYVSCSHAFNHLSQTIEKMRVQNNQALNGVVRIGVPNEFGNNVIIPILSDWMSKHPTVKVDFFYGYGDHLIQLLEKGDLDVAFADSVTQKRSLDLVNIYQEKLVLVSTVEYLKKKGPQYLTTKTKLSTLKDLDFLEYEHKESILRLWFNYHFGKKNIPLNIRAWAMNVQGVANFVKAHLGAAILPEHAVEKLLQEGAVLHTYKGSKENLTNTISMVKMKNKPFSRTIEDCLAYLEKNLRKL